MYRKSGFVDTGTMASDIAAQISVHLCFAVPPFDIVGRIFTPLGESGGGCNCRGRKGVIRTRQKWVGDDSVLRKTEDTSPRKLSELHPTISVYRTKH